VCRPGSTKQSSEFKATAVFIIPGLHLGQWANLGGSSLAPPHHHITSKTRVAKGFHQQPTDLSEPSESSEMPEGAPSRVEAIEIGTAVPVSPHAGAAIERNAGHALGLKPGPGLGRAALDAGPRHENNSTLHLAAYLLHAARHWAQHRATLTVVSSYRLRLARVATSMCCLGSTA
jgi:hypothetical protein